MYLPVPVSEPVVCSSHIAFEGILGLFPELCSDWMLLAASGLMHDGSHVVDFFASLVSSDVRNAS